MSAFGSGHDARVLGSSSASDSLLSREPASPSVPPLALAFSVSVPVSVSLSQTNK